jgi:hypothetical protein
VGLAESEEQHLGFEERLAEILSAVADADAEAERASQALRDRLAELGYAL